MLYFNYLILYVKYLQVYWYPPNIYAINNIDFWNTASESGLTFPRDIQHFLQLVIFPCSCSCEALTPECVQRPWDHFSVFHKKVKHHSNTQVEHWFSGFSLIFVFSSYFDKLSWTKCNPPFVPPPPSPPG